MPRSTRAPTCRSATLAATLVLEGELVIGEVKTLTGTPPVTVTSDDGGAVSVTVAGRDLGFLGETGQPATKVFQAPSR